MNRFIQGVVGAAVFALAAEGAAQADVTGYVSGKINLWNNNGNYCPVQGTCTGSRFPESQRGNQPFSNAAINLYDAANNFIGEGNSATDGTFLVSWTAKTRPTQIRMRFYAYHRDGRFYFTDTAGGLYNWFTGLINTVANTTPTNPQPIGTTWSGGSSGSPNPYANAYWAAEKLWRTVFNLVGVLQTNFTQVEIRGFADNIPGFRGECTSSCASGPDKQVQLDAAAGFKPQARVMHEMGHIATYVTHPWERTNNYNFPDTVAGGGGWSRNEAEWGVSGFEEAFATHYGSIAFWGANATAPTTCNSTQSCYTVVVGPPASATPLANTNIEATSFPFATNNCVGGDMPESRWPLSHMRYFWDVFDSNNDATADTYSANAGDFWRHLHNLAWYPEGTGANDIDEPWNSDYSAVTNRDGRGSSSYRANYNTNVVNTSGIRTANCTPP
jgi:hypothetical protein